MKSQMRAIHFQDGTIVINHINNSREMDTPSDTDNGKLVVANT